MPLRLDDGGGVQVQIFNPLVVLYSVRLGVAAIQIASDKICIEYEADPDVPSFDPLEVQCGLNIQGLHLNLGDMLLVYSGKEAQV